MALIRLHPMHPPNQIGNLITAHQRAQRFHNHRIGTDGVKGINILLAPVAKDEARGFNAE
jgi:hypothetical protein